MPDLEKPNTIPIEPFRFEDPERHAIAMREVSEVLLFEGEGRQKISGLWLNRDFSEKPAIIEPDQMFSVSTTDEIKYIAFQQAAAYSEHPVMVLDMPAHGHSYNLTSAQRREIFLQRRLGLLARSQATAVRNRLPETKQIILTGKSLGARVAPDLAQEAAKLDMEPLLIVGFEMVGLEKRLTANVSAAYFINEVIKTRRKYMQNPKFQSFIKAYEEQFLQKLPEPGPNTFKEMRDVFKHDPSLLLFLLARSPLASDTGVESLERAMDSNKNMSAALVIGGLSSICRWRKIAPTMEHLKHEFPQQFSYDIWPNDSHGLAWAPLQPLLTAYTKKRIASLALNS
jgi:pimeloyl-ACP methyl ester carboxylesterase